jgi:hypothetical protein
MTTGDSVFLMVAAIVMVVVGAFEMRGLQAGVLFLGLLALVILGKILGALMMIHAALKSPAKVEPAAG